VTYYKIVGKHPKDTGCVVDKTIAYGNYSLELVRKIIITAIMAGWWAVRVEEEQVDE
jgi:hypothetical protein